MAGTPADVSDEVYAELREHFTENRLVELAASAAQENYRARFNRVFDV
jgi:alkylhydroperoxidase family enzyme